MRIGVDVRELQRGVRTGIGRMVEAVLSEVPKIRPDHRIFLYADRTTRRQLKATGDEYRVLRQPTTLWYDQVELPRAFVKDDIDIFWSPYYKAPIFSPCPTAITIHDILFLKIGGGRLQNALFKPWARFIGSRTSVILTDSEYSRRDLEILLGLDLSRIQVVPLGVSEQFSPAAKHDAPRLLERLGIPERYILTVTNFRPHKNDQTLIRAFYRLASKEPDVALVLAGRAAGPVGDLVGSIDRLGLRNRVFFPGLIADEDLPALYAGARVFAFPSNYEGFGLPVLEAMASGVPVVCSSASSLPEVVGDSGQLLEPTDEQAWSDTIYNLLKNEPSRQKRIQSGLERAKAFTWQRAVSKLLNVLEDAAR